MGEAMKSRVYMIMPVLMIGLAMPACAQQISEQEANQAARSVAEVFDKALREKDAAGAAALFTENAIRVMAEGPQIGRPDIEKAFTGLFKVYTSEFDKTERVTVIGNDVIGSVSSFAGTYNGPKGPEALKGYATFIYVRDGNTWKIRMETVSTE
jgi:uncharacterized protein (TIGR02246 family)